MRQLVFALALALAPVAAVAESDAPGTEAAPRPVISEIVPADPARARHFPGVVSGLNDATIGFLTAGRLAAVSVEVGDRVARGDVLATLDQVTLEQDVTQARAAVDAAEAKAQLAVQQYERVATLRDRGVASAVQLDDARANRDATAAQAENARASLAQAEDAAKFGTLTAPRDAVVLAVKAEPGETVTAGTPVVELADPMGREAVIDVPEAFAELLPADAGFEVRRHGQTGAPIAARLSVVDPVTDTNLGTRRLRLRLDAPPEDFRIGSLISATFAAERSPLITVPRVAVVDTDAGAQLWRVEGAERRVAAVAVTLGAEIGDRVVVSAGIEVGDEIVTRGVHSLVEGQIVGDSLQ
ncbi:MAG: efflux RND transporter periplasmic adaptor subunit [Paracoccaceae bacterium]